MKSLSRACPSCGQVSNLQSSRSETYSERAIKGWALSVNSNAYTLIQRAEPVCCTLQRAQQHAMRGRMPHMSNLRSIHPALLRLLELYMV